MLPPLIKDRPITGMFLESLSPVKFWKSLRVLVRLISISTRRRGQAQMTSSCSTQARERLYQICLTSLEGREKLCEGTDTS